jgi:tetratricopeptide (TPR) repeat protein
VAISTFATWDDVARWERKIRAHCWDCTLDLKKIVSSVKRDWKSDEDVARELTYWVRRQIRYVSSGERHDFTPHTPEHIYRDRFGDCKDGVQLLSVLLKEAGIPSLQISLNALGDGQVLDDVPSPMTTHAILLATIGGKDHWIDTTVSQAAWDFLPKSDRDRAAYGVNDSTFRLLRTPKMTAEDNRAEVVTRMRIDPDGTCHNVRESMYYGEAALEKRDEWVDVSDAERRKLIRAELLDNTSKVKLADKIGIDEKVLRTRHLPVKAVIEFDVPKLLLGSTELEGSIADNSLWSKFLSISVDTERTQPIEMKEPFESRQTFIAEAPLGYRFSGPPEDRIYVSKWGKFTRTTTVSESGRVWTVVFHTKIDRTRIDPADFEAFLTFQEHASAAHRAYLTMKPAESAKSLNEDIKVLEMMVEKQPKNAALAIDLVKLFLKADDRDKAMEFLRAARKAHPDNRTLLELAGKVPEDFKDREAAYRELIKRFPEESKYQLELARELIDASETKRASELLQPLTKSETPETKAAALLLLAQLSLETKDAAKALERLNDAKLVDADAVDTAEAHRLEGEIHEALAKDVQAIEAFRKALAFDGKDGSTLESLVRLYAKTGKNDEALKYLREYVEADGIKGTAATWFFKLGRFDDAEKMLQLDPPTDSSDPGYRTLGLIKFRHGQWDEAAGILKRAKPSQADQLHALIVSNLMLGRLGDAIDWVRSKNDVESTAELKQDVVAIERLKARRDSIQFKNAGRAGKPPEVVDCFVCAEYLHSLGKVAEAQPLLAKAILADLGQAFGLRGEISMDKGLLTKALADAEKAIKLAPKDARGYYVRGRVLYERARKEATGDLKIAVELSAEKDAFLLHWLAAALIRDRRPGEARSAQLKAAMLRPDDPAIKEQLQQIEDVLSRGQ